eukprot:408855_1
MQSSTMSFNPPLHLSSEEGDVNRAKELLACGANPNALGRNCRTALHVVAMNNNTEIAEGYVRALKLWPILGKEHYVELLLNNGAKIDPLTSHSLTPLHIASFCGSDNVVDLLLKRGANIERIEFGGWKPIHHACNSGHSKCVKLLLDVGCNVSDSTVELGFKPLHLACRSGNIDAVRALLDKGADANCHSGLLLTPLHMACQGDHIQVVKYLLDYDAQVHAADEAGITPIDLTKSEEIKTLIHNIGESVTA